MNRKWKVTKDEYVITWTLGPYVVYGVLMDKKLVGYILYQNNKQIGFFGPRSLKKLNAKLRRLGLPFIKLRSDDKNE